LDVNFENQFDEQLDVIRFEIIVKCILGWCLEKASEAFLEVTIIPSICFAAKMIKSRSLFALDSSYSNCV